MAHVNSKVDNRGPGVSSTVLGLNPAYQHVWKLQMKNVRFCLCHDVMAAPVLTQDITPFPRKQTFGTVVLQIFASFAMIFWPLDP